MTEELPPRPGDEPPEPPRNSIGKFILRMLLGGGIGVAGCIVAGVLTAWTNNLAIGSLPLLGAFALAIYVGLAQRKYGYVTGVILAPFLVITTLVVLLFMECAKSGGGFH